MMHGFKARVRDGLSPLVGFLASTGVHPNVLTVAGLALAVVAGFAVAQGRVREGGVWLLTSGLFDMLDGEVARRRSLTSPRGAFLDSTLDRYAEGAFLAGLTWHYAARGDAVATLVAIFFVALGSLLVSYARARAESLGASCRVGVMERPERLILLIGGALAGGPILVGVLWALAVLTNVTAIHRVVHVYRQLES